MRNLFTIFSDFGITLSEENQKDLFNIFSQIQDMNALDYSLHINEFYKLLFIEFYENDMPILTEEGSSEMVIKLTNDKLINCYEKINLYNYIKMKEEA